MEITQNQIDRYLHKLTLELQNNKKQILKDLINDRIVEVQQMWETYLEVKSDLESLFKNIEDDTTPVVPKVAKVKAKSEKAPKQKRGHVDAAAVVAAVKKSMPKGISKAKLQKKSGVAFPTFNKWLKDYADENNIVLVKADKGSRSVYKLKA